MKASHMVKIERVISSCHTRSQFEWARYWVGRMKQLPPLDRISYYDRCSFALLALQNGLFEEDKAPSMEPIKPMLIRSARSAKRTF